MLNHFDFFVWFYMMTLDLAVTVLFSSKILLYRFTFLNQYEVGSANDRATNFLQLHIYFRRQQFNKHFQKHLWLSMFNIVMYGVEKVQRLLSLKRTASYLPACYLIPSTTTILRFNYKWHILDNANGHNAEQWKFEIWSKFITIIISWTRVLSEFKFSRNFSQAEFQIWENSPNNSTGCIWERVNLNCLTIWRFIAFSIIINYYWESAVFHLLYYWLLDSI